MCFTAAVNSLSSGKETHLQCTKSNLYAYTADESSGRGAQMHLIDAVKRRNTTTCRVVAAYYIELTGKYC